MLHITPTVYPHCCVFPTTVIPDKRVKDFVIGRARLIHLPGSCVIIGFPSRQAADHEGRTCRTKFPRSVVGSLAIGPSGQVAASCNIIPLGAPSNLVEVDSQVINVSSAIMILNVSPELFAYYVSSLPKNIYDYNVKLAKIEEEKAKFNSPPASDVNPNTLN